MKQNQLDFRRGRTLRRFAVMVCLLLLGFSGVRAQDRYEVTGVITDANAQPVVGASIVEKGTTRGTTSSTDGSYTFRVSSPDAVLVYSFFGCKTQEVAVANRTKIDIVLQEDAIALEEVVAIGYGTMKKSDLTGAVASVKSELLDTSPSPRSTMRCAARLPVCRCARTTVSRAAAPRSASAVRARSTVRTSRCMSSTACP